MGQKNKVGYFAQNRFLAVYTKLKSSASRSRKPVSEGPERLGAFLKKFPKVRKRGVNQKVSSRVFLFLKLSNRFKFSLIW